MTRIAPFTRGRTRVSVNEDRVVTASCLAGTGLSTNARRIFPFDVSFRNGRAGIMRGGASSRGKRVNQVTEATPSGGITPDLLEATTTDYRRYTRRPRGSPTHGNFGTDKSPGTDAIILGLELCFPVSNLSRLLPITKTIKPATS